jgi:hypothetical protein
MAEPSAAAPARVAASERDVLLATKLELVGHFAPAARSRAARGVVHIAAGGGGAHIDGQHQRISHP